MYRVETIVRRVESRELLEWFYDPQRFLGFCKACSRYGACWSCPPYGAVTPPAVGDYGYVYLVGSKLCFDAQVLAETRGAEAVRRVTDRVMEEAKRRADGRMVELERRHAGSAALSSGGCRLCARCARREGAPCRHPQAMRLSLESIGFDVVGLTEQCLGQKLLWAGERLPAYYLLVNALLSDDGRIVVEPPPGAEA